MNLRMWSQKHLRKPQSVNTGRRWHKTLPCKAKIKHQQHPEAPPTSVGPSSSQMDWPKVEKCAVVWRVIIQFFGEIMCVKRRKTIQILFSSKFRSIICEVRGGVVLPVTSWVTSVEAALMISCTYSNKCFHPDDIFKRLDSYWKWSTKYNIRNHRQVIKLRRTASKWEWERTLLSILQQLVSSVSRCLLSVVKKRSRNTVENMLLGKVFWNLLQSSISECVYNVSKKKKNNKVDQFGH